MLFEPQGSKLVAKQTWACLAMQMEEVDGPGASPQTPGGWQGWPHSIPSAQWAFPGGLAGVTLSSRVNLLSCLCLLQNGDAGNAFHLHPAPWHSPRADGWDCIHRSILGPPVAVLPLCQWMEGCLLKLPHVVLLLWRSHAANGDSVS